MVHCNNNTKEIKKAKPILNHIQLQTEHIKMAFDVTDDPTGN